ncbi:hypothetical protein [Burkholderia arboris]|uniref:hypothetical protein n=1 Tax=Burkholderia arboris TaxID=488730 RepID=UPI00158BDC13|nr:hypothetical protein [Burkholderia arboris]
MHEKLFSNEFKIHQIVFVRSLSTYRWICTIPYAIDARLELRVVPNPAFDASDTPPRWAACSHTAIAASGESFMIALP